MQVEFNVQDDLNSYVEGVHWSPDNNIVALQAQRQIIFRDGDFDGEVNVIYDVGGSSNAFISVGKVVWSPDSQFVAIQELHDRTIKLFLFNPATQKKELVMDYAKFGYKNFGLDSWITDSKGIILYSDADMYQKEGDIYHYTYDVYKFNLDNNSLEFLFSRDMSLKSGYLRCYGLMEDGRFYISDAKVFGKDEYYLLVVDMETLEEYKLPKPQYCPKIQFINNQD